MWHRRIVPEIEIILICVNESCEEDIQLKLPKEIEAENTENQNIDETISVNIRGKNLIIAAF